MLCCVRPTTGAEGFMQHSGMTASTPFSTTSYSQSASNQLIDLENIVLGWVKEMLEVTKVKIKAREKKFIQYNINWSHLINESSEPEYNTVYGTKVTNAREAKEEVCLFKSTFTNTTDREQEYSFKTERSTRSAVTVVVEKGICRGMDMSLKLKTPCEVVEANSGFHQEMNVTHIGENTIEEELNWSVDSTIRVPPLCETVAELVILEDYQTRSFSINSHLSGRIVVSVTNKKNNNNLITIVEAKISDIINGLRNDNPVKPFFTVQNGIVSYTTKGVCKFKYGVEQKVKITERPEKRIYYCDEKR